MEVLREKLDARQLSFGDASPKDSKRGVVHAVKSSMVVARNMLGCALNDIVHVGRNALKGEIVQLEKDAAVVQMYENTSGLQVGDPVFKTWEPLSVELGPGLIGSIYDGLQRPLESIEAYVGGIFLPPGVTIPALDASKLWDFTPNPTLTLETVVCGGDLIGVVQETPLVKHSILLPPGSMGKVTRIAPAGKYALDDDVLEVDFEGVKRSFSLRHRWPVKRPRPFLETLESTVPLHTGQRVLDCIAPAVLGGTTALLGGPGLGKSVIIQCLAKYSNVDVMVYVGCGERATDVAEILMELPEVRTASGSSSVLQKMCVVATTSNMPVCAREASIYTGITIAEYYRDMGLDVALFVDSTSRWGEALIESGSFKGGTPARRGLRSIVETPGERGYPASLPRRLASFYGRAGTTNALGSPKRVGSVSIVGVVSPPGGDPADPLASATLNIVQTAWGLDVKLARRKHFPSISWEFSFTSAACVKALEAEMPEEFHELRTLAREILRREEELAPVVREVGKSNMQDKDLNGFTSYDRFCPEYKSFWMLKNMCHFYSLCTLAVSQGIPFDVLIKKLSTTVHNLENMKFEDPSHDSQSTIVAKMKRLFDSVSVAFKALQ